MRKKTVLMICLWVGVLVHSGRASTAAGWSQGTELYTPAQAVRAFYMALVDGRLDEARGLAAAPLVAHVSKNGGFPAFLRERTGGAAVRGIQTTSEQITGERALVTYRFHFTNNPTKAGQESLVKEGGVWKVTVSAPKKR